MPGCQVKYAKDGGPDKRTYRVDFGKLARTLPASRPKWNARAGARELYETFQKLGVRVEDFEGPRYKRIDHIKLLRSEGLLDSELRWAAPVATHQA